MSCHSCMSGAQFDVVVRLLRGDHASDANIAARRVLVDNQRQVEAREGLNATRSTVSDAVKRYKNAFDEIQAAWHPRP